MKEKIKNMKNWIAICTSLVCAYLAYTYLFFITTPLIALFIILLDKTWLAGLSIFMPGIIYFLIMYCYLTRGRIKAQLKKVFKRSTTLAV